MDFLCCFVQTDLGAHETGHGKGDPLRVFKNNYRWIICGLLLLGTTKNYVDRQILGVLKVTLQSNFGWSEIDYSNLILVFQGSYAVGMLVVGRMIDRLGTRVGYALAMFFWSVASMAHAACGSLLGFAFARGALGFWEAGVFPASTKCVSEWFPAKERATANGIFNAGTNLGAMLTPFFAPWVVFHLGWRWAFLIAGSLGFAWLLLWLGNYRKPQVHPNCTPEELSHIKDGLPEATGRIPWRLLLGVRQTWAIIGAKFLVDPIWWFYLFWIPDFLHRRFALSLSQIGLPIMVIYVISDLGSIAGGWSSSRMMSAGWSANRSRKTAMLLCALLVLPVIGAYRVERFWIATFIIALAAAAHSGFSANLYTLASDLFPSQAVGSVIGIGGFAAGLGGMLIAKIVGYALQRTGSYMAPFFIAGMAYLCALLVIHVLSPNLEPVSFSSSTI
jgi:MFS transporter, ACS family, aldohexuronate transporter